MKDINIKSAHLTHVTPAEEVFQRMDDEDAVLSPATAEALKAAFTLVGNELARREVLARRAGDMDYAQQLMFGINTLIFAESCMDEDRPRDDFLWDAEDLRDELGALPPPDPEDEDAWVLKD